MKLLTFGFYDDFSRFFLNLGSRFSEHRHESNNLSGALYSLVHGKSFSWIWLKSLKFRGKAVSLTEKEINFCLEYNKKDKEYDHEAAVRLLKQYYLYWENVISEFRPDAIVSSGDSRIHSRILKLLSEKNQILIWYFEQGPFGTTVLSPKGVNANLIVDEVLDVSENLDLELSNIQSFMKRKRSAPFKRKLIYRLFDNIVNLFPFRFFLPFDLREKGFLQKILSNKKIKTNLKSFSTEVKNNYRRVVLLALQVPEDANMILHSPSFSNHWDIVKEVHSYLGKEDALIVREHPLFRQRYEENIYSLIKQEKNVYISRYEPLSEVLNHVTHIVVNNSMMGVEVLLTDIPVIALGDSYYRKYIENKNMKDFLQNPLIDKKVRLRFLKNFLFSTLYEGHFRDEDQAFCRRLAESIIAQLQSKQS